MEKGWAGLPYYPISQLYNKYFGAKVYKIPVSVVDNCPNRMGLKGMETCVFCDEWGSAAKSESFSMDLPTQIETYRQQISKKYKTQQFLIYFQAYTNTFTKLSTLENNFAQALQYDFVKGLVIGTRPDCISLAVLKLWQATHEKSFVGVELGIQSFFDPTLQFLRRGHTRAQCLEAIHKIADHTQVDLGIHLIFGNPNESDEQIIESAELINDLPITNVKLHNLHALKNTPLESAYHAGQFQPISLEEYSRRVILFLQHLSPRIAIHRLAAFASRWDELVAPAWNANKMATHQFIIDSLRKQQTYQSALFWPTNEEEKALCLQLKNQSRSLLVPPADLEKSSHVNSFLTNPL